MPVTMTAELHQKRLRVLKWLSEQGRPVRREEVRQHFQWTQAQLSQVVCYYVWFTSTNATVWLTEAGFEVLSGEKETTWKNPSTLTPAEKELRKTRRKVTQHEEMEPLRQLQGRKRMRRRTMTVMEAEERQRRIEEHTERVARGA